MIAGLASELHSHIAEKCLTNLAIGLLPDTRVTYYNI